MEQKDKKTKWNEEKVNGSVMEVHNLSGRSRTGYTTWGCVWEQGKLHEDSEYLLENEEGTRIPVQSKITAWWPDHSVKWTAHTADAARMGSSAKVTALSLSQEAEEKQAQEQAEVSALDITDTNAGWQISNGYFTFEVPREGRYLLREIKAEGKPIAEGADSLLILEHRSGGEYEGCRKTKQYVSALGRVSIVERGPLQLVIKYEGIHVPEQAPEDSGWPAERIPFIIYLKIGAGEKKFRFTHTFFYDGNEEEDFLKGLGVRFYVPMGGGVYNRHVKFEGDYGCVHEALVQLLGGKKVPGGIYEEQMKGMPLTENREGMQEVKENFAFYPVWDQYELCQDSAQHFGIRKKLQGDSFCSLETLHGGRCPGGAAFGSENGSLLFALRDFWQKYPSGYTFRNLSTDLAEGIVWIYSPLAESMDFRHYTDTGYSQVYYEGYPWKGADPKGVACTSEFAAGYSSHMIPEDEELHAFRRSVDKPAQYVGTPEYYHERKAFGYWSLPRRETPAQNWLEDQLDKAMDFYLGEAEQRNWYGLFNYGDVMHSYDIQRHIWRYDIGGYAWDNTELVPTYWIWYAFLRSGREDIFSFGERMTRHASEVDVYHFGPLKGLGSRHNVRHWGCPCKELRIAMAGHDRFYYYLTGDERLGDIMDDFADVEEVLLYKDPIGAFYEGQEKTYPTHARSGPDWSSLCANWMTKWERRQDEKDLEKIRTGIGDIKKAPLRLISGPDYEFDPASCHLRYIGENATGGSHLQICMGAAQIWLELSLLLQDEEWTEMLEEYGRFYFLEGEAKQAQTEGIISGKGFTLPMLAAGIGAFAAGRLKDEKLSDSVWLQILGTVMRPKGREGFAVRELPETANQEKLREIPWISTNTTAQWCLNTIMCLEFIREWLPEDMEGINELLEKGARKPYRGL